MSSPQPGGRGARAGSRAPDRPSRRSGGQAAPRSSLRVVPEQQNRPGRAFVVLLVGVLAAGLVGLLVLNTAMQRSAFRLEALEVAAAETEVRRQVLDLQIDRMRSPEVLGQRATELGMVAMTDSAFLQLPGGEIIGDPAPAVAGVGVQLLNPPTWSADPKRAPKPDRQPNRVPKPDPGPHPKPDREADRAGDGRNDR